jgi:hypothetical protein
MNKKEDRMKNVNANALFVSRDHRNKDKAYSADWIRIYVLVSRPVRTLVLLLKVESSTNRLTVSIRGR